MTKVLSLVVLCALLVSGYSDSAEQTISQGEVWPKPQTEKKGNIVFGINIEHFEFKVINSDCDVLQKAIKRCQQSIVALEKVAMKYARQFMRDNYLEKSLKDIEINLRYPCGNDYPQLGVDESYNLTVSETSVLKSNSIWGIVRGLETFSQLFYVTYDYKNVAIKNTDIIDYPYYLHRGLLLDTSRHYISKKYIMKTLDAMAMNKMNVFHWHIVDDQSFPYVSSTYPELSEKGAYYPTFVYTKTDIEIIRDHARDLGIRVLVEFDTPGHTRSWGNSHPEILTECEDNSLGPMNPIRNVTYDLLWKLFDEVRKLFPDKYLHLGGDEVASECWKENPEIIEYMTSHHVTDINQLSQLFFSELTDRLHPEVIPIVWEEMLIDARVTLTNNTVVQVWKGNGSNQMAKVLKSGYVGIQSGPYYLDHLRDTFTTFYKADPRRDVKKLVDESLLANLIGGEACMWSEMVDDTNVLSRVWPRASAVAEVLWSVTDGKITSDVLSRIEEHTCRMNRRGIPASPPAHPGYCVL